MGFFDRFRRPDLQEGVNAFRQTEGALLLDVREEDEYAQGHVPGSLNLPLSRIRDIDEIADDAEQPLFLYCLSGARSAQAAAALQQLGYTDVRNIGGLMNYSGDLEK